jgi:hypothetical protein
MAEVTFLSEIQQLIYGIRLADSGDLADRAILVWSELAKIPGIWVNSANLLAGLP